MFVGPSLLILVHCAELKQVTSLQDVISHMCGRFFGILSQLCITMGGFGACVAILILIGDQLVDSMLIVDHLSIYIINKADICVYWICK